MAYNYPSADTRCPNMGLNGIVCESPKYWCALHQVWLSEEDVQKKHCNCKPDMDMIGVHKCNNLREKDYNEFVNNLSA